VTPTPLSPQVEGEELTLSIEASNGGSIEYWRRYLECEGQMLHRRTYLMVNYQHANRALDKAKPNRKMAVSTHRITGILCTLFRNRKTVQKFCNISFPNTSQKTNAPMNKKVKMTGWSF